MLTIAYKCGKRYQVVDKYAGREVRCRNCQEMIAIPKGYEAVVLSVPPRPEGDEPESKSNGTPPADAGPNEGNEGEWYIFAGRLGASGKSAIGGNRLRHHRDIS
jgi:hypothetical protein